MTTMKLLTLFSIFVSGYICETTLDWRDKNVRLPVHNQSQCLSAGTVNVLDMISAIRSLKTGKSLEPMSAQEVFDCNPDWCICNTTISAYDIIQSIYDNIGMGLDLKRDHPFTGQCAHTCNLTIIAKTAFRWEYAGWSDPWLPYDQEEDLSLFLEKGPVVVYTKSSSRVFQTYAGGILDSHECNTTGPFDHSLLLVGEGVDNGTDYWLARNSYGEGWGEKGYIRLAKGYICETTLDWRDKKVILPVHNKSECLSAGTVDVLDMISAVRTLKTGKPLEPMSAQEVFDCSEFDHDPSWCICINTTVTAYDVAQTIDDIMALDVERDHPFTGQCAHTCDASKIFTTGFRFLNDFTILELPWDEEANLIDYLATGPLVVYTKSSSHVFQAYAGGILDSLECNTTDPLDHSLLLVGEGVDNGTDYWLARNSYGEDWGEKGYIRLAKGKNVCGVGLGYVR
ncbi:unnamed protein product, partial [Oppiella nova]